MEDNNVELRQEVFKSDAAIIANWLEDTEITQYLNEKQNVSRSIKDIMYRVNMPILTHLFNKNGSFFMVTTSEKEPVGFLRLVPKNNVTEMVIVIGDKDKWGKGLGTNAILEGLKHAFFQWRANEVVAKINFKNQRSRRVFRKIGFTEYKELAKEMQYSMSIEEFLELVA
ncbi:GNAT family N-acetyltransferase [Clostridium botulinum]|uniref:GNAT family N-acetyltransferase n=1 Tax=Clostridium botulinum TaxID=1491 RepID=UPI0013FBBDC6|nr:GNAT family protein [Clostridium botulinum]MBY6889325.1 GNAT family N-acetyltransferase [Clostridium botulinum]NFI45848.1 GNAT family N-acetyltransferase [Clostridium botulinum]NFJ90082.1 GNAT family N-acetyltransferase [Clostridium botulinum]HBJ2610229.1 GNAT family N-acetyltransferase [Clostridium botulinum]HDI3119142.1 GNAT family N-acetyltransferase [Clostridium botulinum]